MNWNKRFKIIQSTLNVQWCRFVLIGGILIVIGITISGCEKIGINKDDYYVKYEVNSSTIYFGGKLNVLITGTNNQTTTFTINTRAPWEVTIGPVKKGFKANLSVTHMGSNSGNLTLKTQISVSKNLSPFALKQIDDSNTPRTSVQISYTIDY